MYKELSTYRAFTTSELKARASLPAQANIIEGAGKIQCSNINTTLIRNCVNGSSNKVSELCPHTNINLWSGFGPIVRTVSNGWLVNSPSSLHKMGDYMGYNHNAIAPHFDVSGEDETATMNPGGEFVFHCKADIGEVDYANIQGVNPGTHVAFSVWKDGTYIDSRVKALSGMKNIADFDYDAADRITVSNITEYSVYTCKIEILDHPSYDYTGLHTICQVPGLEDWETTIIVLAANHFYVSAPYASWPPVVDGNTYTFGEWILNLASLYTSTGRIMWQYLCTTSYPNQSPYRTWPHMHIHAYIEEGYFDGSGIWQGTKVTDDSALLFDGAWATDSAVGEVDEMIWRLSGQPKALPIPGNGYGYRVVIYCNPTA